MSAAIYYLNCKDTFELDQTTYDTDLNEFLIPYRPYAIRRGDCICLSTEEERFQNEYVYVYDGRQFTNLETTYHTYGHVPSWCTVSDSEFNPSYWSDVIWHSHYFFPAEDIQVRAAHSIKFGLLDGIEHPVYHATFPIGAALYTLVFDHESFELEDMPMDVIELFVQRIHSEPWQLGICSDYLEYEPAITNSYNYLLVG